MNPLIEDAVFMLTQRGWQEIVPIAVLAILRPLGLLYSFSGFAWTLSNGRLVRVVLALSIGLPMVFMNITTIDQLVANAAETTLPLAVLAATEIGIGFAMGLLASLPFFAMQYAGAITDQFRGESDSGLQSPTGGTITTFGALYMVIALAAFAHADGIGFLTRALYQSYLIWPLTGGVPPLTQEAVVQVIELFTRSLLLAVRLALPLLALLYTIEFTVSIAARVARRYNFYNQAFPFKNLATLLALPIIVSYFHVFVDSNLLSILSGFIPLPDGPSP